MKIDNNLLTNSNRKTKKASQLNNARVYEFNLPAISSCPFADACKQYCYADKGTYKYKAVQDKYNNSYALTKETPALFYKLVQKELIKKRVEFLRIHSSGDFYSLRYLKMWVTIARTNPSIIFYGYTKSVPLFQHITPPSNFIFCFSTGGKMDHLIKKTDRRAVIFNSATELKKARFTDCSVNDLKMITTNKVGLIAH